MDVLVVKAIGLISARLAEFLCCFRAARRHDHVSENLTFRYGFLRTASTVTLAEVPWWYAYSIHFFHSVLLSELSEIHDFLHLNSALGLQIETPKAHQHFAEFIAAAHAIMHLVSFDATLHVVVRRVGANLDQSLFALFEKILDQLNRFLVGLSAQPGCFV